MPPIAELGYSHRPSRKIDRAIRRTAQKWTGPQPDRAMIRDGNCWPASAYFTAVNKSPWSISGSILIRTIMR
jgi:hypothetical protein